jgi:aryl-alcohol dehydrogenase-like predicted oxidoreductase
LPLQAADPVEALWTAEKRNFERFQSVQACYSIAGRRAFRVIDAMRPIAKSHAVSVARVALAWLLQKPPVTSVIIGAKTMEQLNDNIAAVDLQVSTGEMAALDQVSTLPSDYPGWMLERQSADRLGLVNTSRS